MTRPRRPGGVPAERTLLAWVRTALSFGGCALLLARLLQRHPDAAVSTGLLGVAAAAAAIGAASARYRAAGAAGYRAPAGSRLPGPAPGLVFAAAFAATVLAAAALVAVLTAG
jgi:uncharacterized membrane protein YidH (DUF202 family)